MFSRKVKSKFLLGTVAAGLTSSFSASANMGGKIANSNSSNSQFLNWGRSILSSKYFDVPVILILLVLYFYIREQSSSGGSSKFVLKESEQEAQERNDAINKIFYERNVLPILKNIKESETKEELLALRKKFQRLERYEGGIGIGFEPHCEFINVILNPEEEEGEEEVWKFARKRFITAIRLLIKEDFLVWANMCASNFSSMEKEKKENVGSLIGEFVNRMKSLQEEGSLKVKGNFDWDDEKISISEKLKFVSEVRADGLQKLAEWTWKTWFVDYPIASLGLTSNKHRWVYKYNEKVNKEFKKLLEKKHKKISSYLSFNFKAGVIDKNGEVKELNKEEVFSRHKKDKFVDSINEKMVKSLNLEGRSISAII